jgi:hypothetical protein
MGEVVELGAAEQSGPTVEQAVAAYLEAAALAPNSDRSYRQTLGRLTRELAGEAALAALTGDELTGALTSVWGDAAPATWNQKLSIARAWLSWCHRQAWCAAPERLLAALDRRREPEDTTRALSRPLTRRSRTDPP